jgi:hypothetical protein
VAFLDIKDFPSPARLPDSVIRRLNASFDVIAPG